MWSDLATRDTAFVLGPAPASRATSMKDRVQRRGPGLCHGEHPYTHRAGTPERLRRRPQCSVGPLARRGRPRDKSHRPRADEHGTDHVLERGAVAEDNTTTLGAGRRARHGTRRSDRSVGYANRRMSKTTATPATATTATTDEGQTEHSYGGNRPWNATQPGRTRARPPCHIFSLQTGDGQAHSRDEGRGDVRRVPWRKSCGARRYGASTPAQRTPVACGCNVASGGWKQRG